VTGFETRPRHIQLLFFGDVVGRAGREAVYQYLATMWPHHALNSDDTATVVMANVENCTHGFGLSHKHYLELVNRGVSVLTGGNHIFDRKETLAFIESAPALVRPANLPGLVPGVGAKVFEVLEGVKLGVLNLLGQSFMGNYNSPLEAMEDYLPQLLSETPLVFIDLHAETTAEKNVLGRLAAQMGVSAMVGTHTHVQTADERLLLGRCGFITDVGFNGSHDSIIGMDTLSSIGRMRELAGSKLVVATEPLVQVNAVLFTLEVATGTCLAVERIREVFMLPETIKLR
jgi:2',3'-cyclic-nucleotide 2'-phosphodiesterase